jgi:hypothetical protein
MPNIVMLQPVICPVERGDDVIEVIIEPEKNGKDISVDTFTLTKNNMVSDTAQIENLGVIHFENINNWSYAGGGLTDDEIKYIATFILSYNEPEVDY